MPFTVPAFPSKIFLKMNSLFDVVNSFAYENFLEESPYFTINGIWQQWFITIVKLPTEFTFKIVFDVRFVCVLVFLWKSKETEFVLIL